MTRLAILAALAVITPVRRGLTWAEGRLVHAQYRIREAGALFVALALVLGACAPMQARRTIADQRRECSAAYERATTTDEIDAIHARCDAAYEEVRDAE